MSLRARLLAGLVVLAAAGLAVAALVTYEEQRSFLFNRLDQQTQAAVMSVSVRLGVHLDGGPRPSSGNRPADQAAQHGRPSPGFQPSAIQPSGTFGELVAAAGDVLRTALIHYGQSSASPPAITTKIPLSALSSRSPHLVTVDSRAGSGLRYRVEAVSAGDARTLIVAVPLGEVDQTLQRLIVVEGLVAGGVILALMLVGWLVIRIGLRPLERIGRVASEIAHGDLTRRVSPANPRTEVGRLGISLNDMLRQIELAFGASRRSEERLREFLADASHELRTPLASIRGYAELIRIGAAEDPAELKRVMSRVEAETARMGALVEDLLLLARMDEMPETQRLPVDLSELAEHAVEDARAVAPQRQITLMVDDTTTAMTLGDANQLRQVFANLLRNAITHTPPETTVEVTLHRLAGELVTEVRDHGPGLAAGSGHRVFDRFWRQESGRSRAQGGTGLGLAIVKAIVEAHHGRVEAHDAPGGGAAFVLTLPAANAQETPRLLSGAAQS